MPSERSRTGPSCAGRGSGGPPGRWGGRSTSRTRCAPRSAATRACSSEWTTHGIRAAQERTDERPVARVRLVRQDVVGDDDDARPAARPRRHPRRAAGRGAPGRRGDDVDEHDDVDVAQPPPGAHPGVGARPGQHAQGPGEGRDVGRTPGHGLLARVERRRVQVAPRDEGDVVPGVGQLVREARRVRGDPTLERVRGTDERDAQGGTRHGVRHRPWTARRGRTAGRARRS